MFLYTIILCILLTNSFIFCMDAENPQKPSSIIQWFFGEHAQDVDPFRNHAFDSQAWYLDKHITPDQDYPVKAACFHPKKDIVMIGYGTKETGTVYLYDIHNNTQTLFAANMAVTGVNISPLGKYLAVGERDQHRLTLFDFETQQAIFSRKHDIGKVKKIVFDPQEKYVATCGRFRNLTAVNIESQLCCTEIDTYIAAKSMSFDPQNNVLAVGTANHCIYFIDTNTWKFLPSNTFSDGIVNATIHSPCGTYLAQGVNTIYPRASNYGYVSLINAKTKYPINKCFIFHDQIIKDIQFHPSGKFLAIATQYKDEYPRRVNVELVNIETKETVFRFQKNANRFCKLSFNETGDRLAIGLSSGVLICNNEHMTLNQLMLRQLLSWWFQVKNQHNAVNNDEELCAKIILQKMANDFYCYFTELQAIWNSLSPNLQTLLTKKIFKSMQLHKEIDNRRHLLLEIAMHNGH